MNKASPKVIGAFVLGGVVLILAGLVTFGSFTFFEQRLPIVMYFDGDLTGLDVGAPLVLKGVRIGTVTDVSLHVDTTSNEFLIPVRADIEPERFVLTGEVKGDGRSMPGLIQKGLRAKLAAQSILTGKLLVTLDLDPGTPVRLLRRPGDPTEVPTLPSAIDELQASLEGVMKKFQDMPVGELIRDLRTLIASVNRSVNDLDAKSFGAISARTIQTLDEAEALLANLNRQVDAIGPTGETAIKNVDQAIAEMRRLLNDARPLIASAANATNSIRMAAQDASGLMATANNVLEPGSPAYRELIVMLRELSSAARSIRAMADTLERNPDSLLFGKASASGRPSR